MSTDVVSFEAGQKLDGRVICGAKTQAGHPCKRNPARGRTRCKKHGGATPRGLALPQTKHGKFSDHMPTRLLANYEAALSDPNLLSVREEMAALTARQAELLSNLDAAAGPAIWREAVKSWRAFTRARVSGDVEGMHGAAADLDAILLGRVDWSVWAELRDTFEGRRRLAETERKLLEAHSATMTADQALLVVASLTDAVREHVKDQRARSAIADAIERAIGQSEIRI